MGHIEVRGGDFLLSWRSEYDRGSFSLLPKKKGAPLESLDMSQVRKIYVPDHAECSHLQEDYGFLVNPFFRYAFPLALVYLPLDHFRTFFVAEFNDGRKLLGKVYRKTYRDMVRCHENIASSSRGVQKDAGSTSAA